MSKVKYLVPNQSGKESTQLNAQNDKTIADIYTRLSRSDGDKVESDSIHNQEKTCKKFLENHPDIIVNNIHKDDNYTGLNQNRPAFIQMMDDIKAGKINCVIVKSLSRLGRNLIEMQILLTQIFPKYNIRFISVTEQYDSNVNPDAIDDLLILLLMALNQRHCKDISSNVRRTFEIKRKKGELVSSMAPYGYIKNPQNNHQLIIDKECAFVVQMIYKWCINGMGAVSIAKRLNELNLSTPSQTKHYATGRKPLNGNLQNEWRQNTVRRILSNIVYLGHLEQKKQSKPTYLSEKLLSVPKEERVLVENTHQPIIDEDTFNKVQEYFARYTRTSPDYDKRYPLSGVIRCADCGATFGRRPMFKKNKYHYVYYNCKTFWERSGKCFNHSIERKQLVPAILDSINKHIETIIDMKKVLSTLSKEMIKQMPTLNFTKQIEKCQSEIIDYEKLKENLLRVYISADTISDEEYAKSKAKYNEEISKLENKIVFLEQSREKAKTHEVDRLSWMDDFTKFYGVKEITHNLVSSLINVIYIHAKTAYKDDYGKVKHYHQITIHFKFEDEFNTAKDYIHDNLETAYKGVQNAI